jgi:hypothetical protein
VSEFIRRWRDISEAGFWITVSGVALFVVGTAVRIWL